MSRVPGKLVVHHRSQGIAIGTVDGFSVIRLFGSVTPEDIYATLKCGEAVTAYSPEVAGSIVTVDPTFSFPSEATRHAAIEVARQTRQNKVAQAIVILGDGFWASALRGVLTTLSTVARVKYAQKVVRHEEEAVEWTIETTGESTGKYRSALLDALKQLRPHAAPSLSASRV